jgi:hypothetical protein
MLKGYQQKPSDAVTLAAILAGALQQISRDSPFEGSRFPLKEPRD